MSQRNSRKNKGKARKQPELRTGGGRRAKAERSRQRAQAGTTASDAGPGLRLRPAGPLGVAFTYSVALLGVAAVAAVGLWLERWNTMSYPDSLWMYLAFGMVAASFAVGRVARLERDTDGWGALSLLVPLGVLVAEAVAGPGCPRGTDCAVVGARGSLGMVGSVALVVLLAFVSWAAARWTYRRATDRRPSHGRVRYGLALVALLTLLVIPGSVVAAALVGSDLLLRDTPEQALDAVEETEADCFGIEPAPELAVRAVPTGYYDGWTTYAVRRAGEDRPGVGKQGLPDDWATYDDVHPYEATVSYNAEGEVVSIECGLIGPDAGNATEADLAEPNPDSNPLSPKTTGAEFLPRFFTQGVAGPSEEAKKQQAADAKAQAAATAKADAKAKGDDGAAADTDAATDADAGDAADK